MENYKLWTVLIMFENADSITCFHCSNALNRYAWRHDSVIQTFWNHLLIKVSCDFVYMLILLLILFRYCYWTDLPIWNEPSKIKKIQRDSMLRNQKWAPYSHVEFQINIPWNNVFRFYDREYQTFQKLS